MADLGATLLGGLSGRRHTRCRVCGCSEQNACYRPDRGFCWWAKPDLCSHCEPLDRERRAKRRWRLALILLVATWIAIVNLTLLLDRPRKAPGAPASRAAAAPPSFPSSRRARRALAGPRLAANPRS